MPTMHEQIASIMTSPDFDDSDKVVVAWQFHACGDFKQALWEAFARADEDNQARLALGFPVEAEGFRRWAYGNLATRLRQAGLDI